MKRINITILFAVSLIIITAAARVINAQLHIPNMVPVAAISVFSGAIMKGKRGLAFLIPLLGQFLGDVFFQLFTNIPGFYDLSGMLFNYGALIGATALGFTMRQPKPLTTIGYLLGASTVFFLVSNFGYFAQGWNGYTMAGFVRTYIDAIPFYKSTLIADLVGGVALFGGYFLLQQKLEADMQKARA